MYEKLPLAEMGIVPGDAELFIDLKGDDPPPPFDAINEGAASAMDGPSNILAPAAPKIDLGPSP